MNIYLVGRNAENTNNYVYFVRFFIAHLKVDY